MWFWIYSAFFTAAAFIIWIQQASQQSIQMLGNILCVVCGVSFALLQLVVFLSLPIHFGIQIYVLIRKIQGRPL